MALYTPPKDNGKKESVPVEAAAVHASRIHTEGFVASVLQYLLLHCDNQNDEAERNYSTVTGTSFLIVSEEGAVERLGFGTYGKKACRDYMEKKAVFGECIEYIKQVWERLPEEEKTVTTDLFEGGDKYGKELANPHTMKTVLYSAHVLRILRKAQ